MKLWQKENTSVAQEIEAFTIGKDQELDLQLAPYDIQGSLAHIRMLEHIGLLNGPEQEQLAAALKRLYQKVLDGNFRIEPGVEDIHSQIELMLTRELGDMGKKIHSGRSRNDQVLVDLRLFFRAEIRSIAGKASDLSGILMNLAEKYQTVLMPGYTHMQMAMVSSFGLWLGAFAESLVDDMRLLQSTYRIINQNPLGSAAGYGSSFPLDRKMTTALLGFDELNYNVVHAQMGRGKTELFLSFALAAFGHTLGKLAMDIVLYLNQNFGFIHFPDELTTGSSIMPHKKNPDLFELIRARCNQLQTLPQQISQLTGNLPSGYHRDFQLLKEVVFPAIHQLQTVMDLLCFALPQMEVRQNILADDQYRYLFTVEEVNRQVLGGIPFRDAYRNVGNDVENKTFEPVKEVHHTHEGSIGNLCLEDIRRKMDRVLAEFAFEKAFEKVARLLDWL